jgi:hypothetical protein
MKIGLLLLLPFTLIAFLPSQSSLRHGHLNPSRLCRRSSISIVGKVSNDRTVTPIFETDKGSAEGEIDSDAAIMAKILAAAEDKVFMR